MGVQRTVTPPTFPLSALALEEMFLNVIHVCMRLHCSVVSIARCLDKAAIKTDRPYPVTMTEVEETKAFLGIMPLFLCICIYQMTYVRGLIVR